MDICVLTLWQIFDPLFVERIDLYERVSFTHTDNYYIWSCNVALGMVNTVQSPIFQKLSNCVLVPNSVDSMYKIAWIIGHISQFWHNYEYFNSQMMANVRFVGDANSI